MLVRGEFRIIMIIVVVGLDHRLDDAPEAVAHVELQMVRHAETRADTELARKGQAFAVAQLIAVEITVADVREREAKAAAHIGPHEP